MRALHRILPDVTPEPHAWGHYARDPNVYFFLCQFVDMTDGLPDVIELAASLAKLHREGVNPEGKYGFPVLHVRGTLPQYTGWEDTWEDFFTKAIIQEMENEQAAQGSDRKMQALFQQMLDKVIPRLLRPLETGGRSIKPCLIHGNGWDRNVSTNVETNKPIMFDAMPIYAHNESECFNCRVLIGLIETVELAGLGLARYRMGKAYMKEY